MGGYGVNKKPSMVESAKFRLFYHLSKTKGVNFWICVGSCTIVLIGGICELLMWIL